MRTINLCGGRECCPKLLVEKMSDGTTVYYVTDDDGGKVGLSISEARNLALAIFKEVGKDEDFKRT